MDDTKGLEKFAATGEAQAAVVTRPAGSRTHDLATALRRYLAVENYYDRTVVPPRSETPPTSQGPVR